MCEAMKLSKSFGKTSYETIMLNYYYRMNYYEKDKFI